jgi:hypothetical protein
VKTLGDDFSTRPAVDGSPKLADGLPKMPVEAAGGNNWEGAPNLLFCTGVACVAKGFDDGSGLGVLLKGLNPGAVDGMLKEEEEEELPANANGLGNVVVSVGCPS